MPADQLPTTSYALLGLLARGPMSGYDLTGLVSRSIANFWPIEKSQVYGELDRLERLGYVRGRDVPQEGLPDKRLFAVTDRGERALDEWLEEPGYQQERRRNAFLVKVFFGWRTRPEVFEELLDRYRAQAVGERDRLRAIVDRLASVPPAAFGRATALYGLRHAEATLAWCDEMRAALPELWAPPLGGAGRDGGSDPAAAPAPHRPPGGGPNIRSASRARLTRGCPYR